MDRGRRVTAWHHQAMPATTQFIEARDLLLRAHENGMAPDFRWPELIDFNWVRDYFDVISLGNEAPALRVVDDTGADRTVTFREMAQRSAQL